MSSSRTEIFSDWLHHLDGTFTCDRAGLIRRLGPVLQGVSLEIDDEARKYRPTTYLHVLTVETPVIGMLLDQRLLNEKGHPSAGIPFSRHSEEYVPAAKRLEAASAIPLRGGVTLDAVLRAFRDRWAKFPEDRPLPRTEIERYLSLLLWGGRIDDADSEMSRLLTRLVATSLEFRRDPNVASTWIEAQRMMIRRGKEGVDAVLVSEIQKHNISGVRDLGLIDQA